MSRSPLFELVRQAVRLACEVHRMKGPSAVELSGMHLERMMARRRFLQVGGAAAAGALITSCGRPHLPRIGAPRLPRLNRRRLGESPRTAIVGAGLAGLTAAFYLDRAGLRADIYEANTRPGGRIHTGMNMLAPGLHTELGGDFIGSSHEDILALISHFELPLVDFQNDPVAEEVSFHFGGENYTHAALAEGLRPVIPLMRQDLDRVGDYQSYRRPARAASIDRLTLSDYLSQLGLNGWVRSLLETACRAEFGLEAGEQSALNFLLGVSTDFQAPSLFGKSDARLKIEDGNQALPDAITGVVGTRIQRPYILEAVTQRATGDYTLSFQRPGSIPQEVVAQAVILAIPFTLLRNVEFRGADLPKAKRRAIDELGYGTNAKVMLGMNSRPWREMEHAGKAFADLPFQSVWDNSRMQGGPAAGLTVCPGGNEGIEVGKTNEAELVARYLPGLEAVFPGVGDAFNGTAARFHWPSNPFSLGSYACYLPGQRTTFGGAEAEPLGNIYFAGEHCSSAYPGSMNGAAESGRIAAQAILARIGSRVE